MIIDLQRRISEVGRIRIGQQVASNGGKGKRPTKLDTFRLTSADRNRIHQAAFLYGGQPSEWEAPAGNQWEVITEADALNVIVPPSDMAFSQHYELWSGGGCQRRCDGMNESISEGPCVCDPDKRECKFHTRLSVMLRDLPGLGVWRIDTQGYYAAVELQGAVEIVQMAAGRGQMLPARLRLEQRMVKRPGQQTKRFAVPVLDIEVSPAQLLSGSPMAMLETTPPGTLAVEPPRQVDGSSPLTPVPESVPEAPAPSVAEQAAKPRERRQRKNAAQPVARAGIRPRTAEEANARTQHQDEPLPPEPPDEGPSESRPKTEAAQVSEASQLDESGMPEPPASGAQNRKMHALFRENQLEDRTDRLAVTSEILGYTITTSSGLTVGEANRIIDTLETAWPSDTEYPIAKRILDILNNATLREAEAESNG